MTATKTASSPDVLDVDSGVIEDAHARQRRHPGGVAVAAALAVLIAVLLAGWFGGGGSSNGARLRGGDSTPGLRPLPQVQSPVTISVVRLRRVSRREYVAASALNSLSNFRRIRVSRPALRRDPVRCVPTPSALRVTSSRALLLSRGTLASATRWRYQGVTR